MHTATWSGIDAPRMEIVRVQRSGAAVHATGTQIGAGYELRYALAEDRLQLEVVGRRALTVELDGCDFFDLGYSPLFNSLPVWRHALLEDGGARDFVMRWVAVPELTVDESHQTYEPLGGRVIRFRSDAFEADIAFDEDGLVVRYEGLAERVA